MKPSGPFRCLFLAAVFLPTFAFAAPKKFDIPAQPLGAALQLFGKQAAADVTYPATALKDIRSTEVKGEMEPSVALEQLLTGTGFTARQTAPARFVVTKIEAPTTGSVKGSLTGEGGKGLPDVLVSIRETAQSAETDRYGVFAFPNVAAGTYVLVASAPGYQTMHITDVQVKAGRELTIGKEEMRKASEGPLALEPFVVRGETVEQLEKIEVTASKQQPFTNGNVDIPRTINDAQPYYIFASKTIDQSGATNIEDFLKQRLTMNAIAQTPSQSTTTPPYGDANIAVAGAYGNLGSTSLINLRGLGAASTLVLIDGHRVAGVQWSGATNSVNSAQPDLNGIPLSAIDRIEVLPSSASGIYGGSAVGGVVNVILKKNYSGGEIRLTYENPWDTDAPLRTASVSYGAALNDGKTHFRFNAQWSDGKPLLLIHRQNLFNRGLAAINRNAPFFLFFGLPLGSLPNIFNQNGSFSPTTPPDPLTLKDGRALGAGYTYVPAGTSPSTPLTTLLNGLLANAGHLNLDNPPTAQSPNGLYRYLTYVPKVKSFLGSVSQQLGPKLLANMDFNHTENKSSIPVRTGGDLFGLKAADPRNPFTSDIYINMPSAAEAPYHTSSVTDTAVLSFTATLPHDWVAEADYTWSHTTSRANGVATSIYDPRRAADASVPNQNPLVDALQYPLDYSAGFGNLIHYYQGYLDDFAVRGSGSLMALPWGTPRLTMGLERSIQTAPAGNYSDLIFGPGPYRYKDEPLFTYRPLITYFKDQQVTDSGYAELLLPLIKQNWLPLVHSLELQASERNQRLTASSGTISQGRNHYTGVITYFGPTLNGQPYFAQTSYKSSNHTIGLKYQPVSDLILRVSTATAFLPPTSAQLIPNPLPDSSPTTITDTNGARYPVQTISGGNPNLRPQHSKSLNAGIIWEPSWAPLKNLRVDAEYYKIQQYDAINSLSAQLLVDNERTFPGRVTRNSSGVITLLDTSLLNLYKLETEGWDFTASYQHKTGIGTFTLNAAESVILHLKTQYSLTQPAYDAVNFPSEGGAGKYKSNLTLTWEHRNWSAGWTARYFSAYKQYGAAGGPDYQRKIANYPALVALYRSYGLTPPPFSPNTTYTAPQGGDTIPSQIYHDFFVGYTFGKTAETAHSARPRLLSNTTLQLGVKNVFNRYPPFDVYYSLYDSPYGDTRLRDYWISVRKAF